MIQDSGYQDRPIHCNSRWTPSGAEPLVSSMEIIPWQKIKTRLSWIDVGADKMPDHVTSGRGSFLCCSSERRLHCSFARSEATIPFGIHCDSRFTRKSSCCQAGGRLWWSKPRGAMKAEGDTMDLQSRETRSRLHSRVDHHQHRVQILDQTPDFQPQIQHRLGLWNWNLERLENRSEKLVTEITRLGSA